MVNSKPDAPWVKFAFVDGTDKKFDSREYLADEMLMDVWRVAMKMDDFEWRGRMWMIYRKRKTNMDIRFVVVVGVDVEVEG